MRPDSAFRWARAVTIGVPMLAAGAGSAQSLSDFHLGSWDGSLDASYEVERDRARSPDSALDVESKRRLAREHLTIRNEGFYFIDPRLANGTVTMTFGAAQESVATNGTGNSNRTRLESYAIDSNFFSAFPYNGTLYANRAQSVLYQPFTRTELAIESRGGTFRLREDSPLRDRGFPFLTANVSAEQQHSRETTASVLGQTFSSDEWRNVLRADGHKGYETGDLDLHYEFADVRDSAVPAATFKSQTASLDYGLDFGPTLNRNSNTHLFLSDRSGINPSKVFTAGENLRIDHLDNFSTGYHYQFGRTNTPGGNTTTQDGAFDLRHVLYKNLTTTAQLEATQQQIPTGKLESYRGQLGFQYQRGLPGDGRVFAGATGQVGLNVNRLLASRVSVTDERQSAPSPLGAGAGFLLNQSFVVVSSIVVVDTRGGARLPTAPGIDYDIVREGSLFRIVPLVTSAVIQPGDPLQVSYVYEVDPNLKYRSTSKAVSAGLSFRWMTLSFGHEVSNQTIVSGQDNGFLQDVRRDTAQLALRAEWKDMQAQGNAGYLRYDATRLAYVEHRFGGLVTLRPSRSLVFNLRADRTSTDFTLPQHRTDSSSAQLAMDWYAPEGWTTSALLNKRIYKDTLQVTETINEASLKARFVYGLLDITSALTASNRTRGGFETTLWHAALTLTRRF